MKVQMLAKWELKRHLHLQAEERLPFFQIAHLTLSDPDEMRGEISLSGRKTAQSAAAIWGVTTICGGAESIRSPSQE